MPSGPPEFFLPFIPVTGMKCSYGKIFSPLTKISVGKTETSGTEPAHPLIRTHWKFYKGFRGEARSRKPGQPGQPGSCEEPLRLVKRSVCNTYYRNEPIEKIMLIVKIQISEKWRRLSFNQEIPCVYPFPGYCSCSDTCNIWLFFKEE